MVRSKAHHPFLLIACPGANPPRRPNTTCAHWRDDATRHQACPWSTPPALTRGTPGTLSTAPRLGGDRAPRRGHKTAPTPTKTTIDRRCQPPVTRTLRDPTRNPQLTADTCQARHMPTERSHTPRDRARRAGLTHQTPPPPALDEHPWFRNAEAATARRGTTSQMRAWDEEDASRVSRRGLRKSSAASVSCSVAETLANRRRRKRAGEWEGARLSFGVSVPAALNGYARSAQTQSCGRESCRSRGRMRQSSTTS